MKEEIAAAIKTLQSGGIILYPTDTIWGLGCDATNEEAVAKLLKLKFRDPSKGMIVLIDQVGKLQNYVKEIPDIAWMLVEEAEEPLTIIYPDAINLAKNLIPEDNSIAIRVVKDDFCKNLLFKFKKGIVSTSANIAGQKSANSFFEIDQQLIDEVDYVVNWRREEQVNTKPSSIIKIAVNGEFKIIRK